MTGLRRTALAGGLVLMLTAVFAYQLAADVGPVHEAECLARTRGGLTFELPDNGITLVEFREAVADSTAGCATVVVREGSTEENATVIEGGTARAALDAAGNRNVYVRTSGPGRQAPPPPTTEAPPQP